MTAASAETAPVQRSPRDTVEPRHDGNAAARRARKEAKAAGTAAKAGRPVGRFARRARNYGRTILWTVRDAFAAQPRKFAFALLLGGLSLAAQALAVLVVFGYGQAIQQDSGLAVPFLGIDWRARTDTGFLLLVVGAFAASLSAGALLIFISKGLLLAIVRRSLARGIERLARAARSLPDPRAPRASRRLSDLGFSTLSAGAASSARGAFLIVQTIPALTGALLATGLLLWLQPVLTAILVLVTAIWAALLYPVSLRVVAFGRKLRNVGGTIRHEHALVPSLPAQWATADEFARAYTGWLRTRAEIVLVVGIGIAVIVAIAISVMGAEMMSGAQDWPVLIAYVGALQVALNGVFRTIRAVAVVSRRYPQMVRNRLFVLDIAGLNRPTAAPRRGETITLGTTGGGQPFTATVGERLAVMTEEPIGRVQLLAIGARDANGMPVRSAGSSRRAPAPIGDETPILFVDVRLLSGEAERAEPGKRVFSDRLVVVVHPTTATVGRFGETRLLVAERQQIVRSVAIGSEEAASVLARVAKRAARREERRQDSHLDDDEEA